VPRLAPPLPSRLSGLLAAVAGLSLLTLSFAWDSIRGEEIQHLGPKQVLGCFVGALLLAVGGWLFVTERGLRSLVRPPRATGLSPWRWWATLLIAGLSTVLAVLLPHSALLAAANWIFWGYYAAACLLLPARSGRLVLLVGVAVGALLSAINAVKVSLTTMPLTMLDVKIAVSNPAGLWDALHLPHWTRHAAVAAAVAAGLWILGSMLSATLRLRRSGPPRMVAQRVALRLGGIVLVLALATTYFDRLFAELDSYKHTWSVTRVVEMAAEVGVLPYLAYSGSLERDRTGDFFDGSIEADPPATVEIEAAVRAHVEFPREGASLPRPLPNIVVVLAESTFDPNVAFRLDRPVESSLFGPWPDTASAGALRVNVVGGGTWVTEFETITGLDTRMFGYGGFYAHASLSPYVAETLATHLESKGYRTTAFFPHDGDFYNYRRAYQAYGFDEIVDSRDRGREDGWRDTDVQVVEDFVRLTGPEPGSPFFSYVLLIENHSPHKCDVASLADMPVLFEGTREFEPNCALHEYLRRLRSTEEALRLLKDYLRRLEARSGRPFVLLVFGDHQAYTFSDAPMVRYDFDYLRTPRGKNITFYNLVASGENRIRCCLAEVPAPLLPTLVSAFVADGPQDVYLGLNLWLYDRCGSDAAAIRTLREMSLRPGAAEQVDTRSATCRSAYAQALAGYRRAGIMQ